MLPRLKLRNQNAPCNPQESIIDKKSFKIIKPYVRQFSQASFKNKNRYFLTPTKSQENSVCINKFKSIQFKRKQSSSGHQTVLMNQIPQISEQQDDSYKTKRYQMVQKQFQSIKHNKNYFQEKSIESFLKILQKINPLFQRIGHNLGKILLQKFTLRSYQKGDIIYNEGQFSKQIYILLWGEVLLKNKAKTFAKYMDPGDSLAENPIIQQKQGRKNFKGINSYYSHTQTAKVITNSGVLLFSLAQYRQIREEIVPLGFRRQLKIFQNLLLWSYSKKAGFRNKTLQ